MKALRIAALVFGLILGIYLIGRAIAEPFVIDFSDPASYRDAWGGPSLAGVLAIHCGFGVLSAIAIGAWLRTKRRNRSSGRTSRRVNPGG